MKYSELESSTVELKSEFPQNDQIIKTAIGFCNQKGGKIVIGVRDDGTILGLSEDKIEDFLEYIEKSIYDASSPPIIPKVYIQRFENKSVMIIQISSGMNKPYYRRSEGITKGTYIRFGRSTVRATEDVIEELKWQSTGVDYETLPLYQASKDEIDLKKVQKFISERKKKVKAEVSDQILDSYRLVVLQHTNSFPTNAGMLLFGKTPQRYIPEAMIICSHFKGNSGRNTIATIDCEGDLFEQFNQASNFILSRLSHSFVVKGFKRKEKLEIPKEAIREALLNAIVHRNYHVKAPIKIAIYDNRIEFFSPGGFPGLMDIKNLLAGITYLRNPAICKIFREVGYIEKLGTGFITIFTTYEKMKLTKPEIIEGGGYVKCILPRTKASKENTQLSDIDKILRFLELKEEATVRDIIELLYVSRATVGRRLKEMLDKGLIESTGKTKSLKYKIKN